MLDFDRLQTPRGDGATLVEPVPAHWHAAAAANHQALAGADRLLLGRPLSSWREQTRQAVAGSNDGLVVVTGHQPDFIHPGVWAKHVVVQRFADAIGGKALNLIVDSDAYKAPAIVVPQIGDDGIRIRRVSVHPSDGGRAYEQLPALSAADVDAIRGQTMEFMGDGFDSSAMPAFLAELAVGAGRSDWVDQAVAARQAVEREFDVDLRDVRASTLPFAPLFGDILLNASAFAASYNGALADYRREYRVRGVGRPIPDLVHDGDRFEVPIWALRSDQPRRRVLVSRQGEELAVYADDELMGLLPANGLADLVCSDEPWSALGGWQLRPRALTLTLWARLLLADLFVHGIGGAKYDRISDLIIRDYYQVDPPHMACVSATVWMQLPRGDVTLDSLREEKRTMRDVQYNPQRHFAGDSALEPLFARRADLVKRSDSLRDRDRLNRSARREVFEGIRSTNLSMLELRKDAVSERRAFFERLTRDLRQDVIARGREYFFALYTREQLGALTRALPGSGEFRV